MKPTNDNFRVTVEEKKARLTESSEQNGQKEGLRDAQEQRLSSAERALDHRGAGCTEAGRSGGTSVLSNVARWRGEAKPRYAGLCFVLKYVCRKSRDPALLDPPTTQTFPLPPINLGSMQRSSVDPGDEWRCGLRPVAAD